MRKPFSPSAEENQAPIFAVLAVLFADRHLVLEIGSGTGQHAVYFGARLPHLTWQATDLEENLDGIHAWTEEEALPNVKVPLALDARSGPWPIGSFDAGFSANAVHIMGWHAVEKMFGGLGKTLAGNATLALYGPFNYAGKFSSESNERFDGYLKMDNPESGVRDFEALDALARKEGFRLLNDFEMPMNNRLLAWRRG
jgi:SAM-dependent methyltransferase